MKKILLNLLCILFFFGCKQNTQKTEKETKKPELSVLQNFPKSTEISSFNEEKIANWQEYNDLNSFLERFSNISSNQILINATELRDLVSKLKTSEKPLFLDKPSLNTRINVLENETLRLADMSLIGSITNDEIVTQTLKIIDVFGSLNQKINTMYSQRQFENAMSVNDSITLPKRSLKIEENKPLLNKRKLPLNKNSSKLNLSKSLKKDKK